LAKVENKFVFFYEKMKNGRISAFFIFYHLQNSHAIRMEKVVVGRKK